LTVDLRAVLVGAGVALAISVPFALVGGLVLDDRSPDGLVFLFVAAVLAGTGVGGFVAGSRQIDFPLTHGALAALAAFAVAQAVSATVDLTQGDDVSPLAVVFNAMLATSVGLIGGLVAARRNDALQAPGSLG
jgi:putative membrane protein (TIGR04086 family)